jgi:diguanylate cyclase
MGMRDECLAEAAENEQWRRKYLDNLRELERDEQILRGREQQLRWLVGRLCLAAQGQSPKLDAALQKLKNAVRKEVDASELEVMGNEITTSVREMDVGTATLSRIDPSVGAAGGTTTKAAILQPNTGATTRDAKALPGAAATALPGEAILGDERIRSVLTRLLTELRSDPRLAEAVSIVDRELSISMTQEQLPKLIERVGGLLVQRIQGLERAREELQQLLDQMLGQLDGLSRFVAGHDLDENERRASSETLNLQITGEVTALGTTLDTGTDLTSIRRQLRLRLDSIGRHLHEFRTREEERSRQARERTDQMRGRMEELEREARSLHASLADEKRMSLLDPLTRVPNRLAYEQRMVDELERWRRFSQPTCIAACDIDHFKRINDSYGHRAGDKVLQVVAECLATSVRSTDFVARYGGEEFVFILPGSTTEDALALLNRIREKVSEIGFHFRGTPVSVTVSCGMTSLRPDDGADDAFDRADKAMYQAKDSGRNRVAHL